MEERNCMGISHHATWNVVHVLLIRHEQSDNTGLARALAVAGYAVHGMDYPGFGLSDGLHGYVPDFDELVEDVMEQYKAIKGKRPQNTSPWIVTIYASSLHLMLQQWIFKLKSVEAI